MKTVEEATRDVLARTMPLEPQQIALERALGLVLAEEVKSDRDSPPFDKALMDGYAVRSEDFEGWRQGSSSRVVERVAAGQVPTRSLARGEASLVMTGAPVPEGCDCVIPRERARTLPEDRVAFDLVAEPRRGQSVLFQGKEMKSGDVVLAQGVRLGPARLALLAAVGRTTVRAHPRARVTLLATGDELVPPGSVPGPGQIRESNTTLLRALLDNDGAIPLSLPIVRDDRVELRNALRMALGAGDLLLVTGGVSAGDLDLVPDTLAELGVECVFHKVRVKPGKPVWFGIAARSDASPSGCVVFGLPGNPASVLVSYLLFVRAALGRLAGRGTDQTRPMHLALAHDYRHQGDRPTYYPISINMATQKAELLDWGGSADLRAIALADGLAVFPAGDRRFAAGEQVDAIPLDQG